MEASNELPKIEIQEDFMLAFAPISSITNHRVPISSRPVSASQGIIARLPMVTPQNDDDFVRQDIRILTSFCKYLSSYLLYDDAVFEAHSKHSNTWLNAREHIPLRLLAVLLARRPLETAYAAWNDDPKDGRPYPRLYVAMALPKWNDEE
jgi:hypothetical protein